jgi:hypothetical protein
MPAGAVASADTAEIPKHASAGARAGEESSALNSKNARVMPFLIQRITSESKIAVSSTAC